MSRRNMQTEVISVVYLENAIRGAINNLSDAVDYNGNKIHEYHNLSLVKNHLDKAYNLQFTLHKKKNISNYQQSQAKLTLNLFTAKYKEIANKDYVKLNSTNYSFECKHNKTPLLVQAIQNIGRSFGIKKDSDLNKQYTKFNDLDKSIF